MSPISPISPISPLTSKGLRVALALSILLLSITSCIRKDYDDCPQLVVRLEVKDKNYYNVSHVEQEQALSETLPFGRYVSNLTYRLRDLATGETVEESREYDVTAATTTDYTLTFDCEVPHGTYELTTWAGTAADEPTDQGDTGMTLSPGDTEGGDPYLTRDTLVYTERFYAYRAELERVKGKLIIEMVNLPAEATASTIAIDHLHQHVDARYDDDVSRFAYDGSSALVRTARWDGTEHQVRKYILPPSTGDRESVLSLDMTAADGQPLPRLKPDDVAITINRNGITVVRYTWDDRKQEYEIQVLINDNWETVHNMGIDDI